MSEQLYAEPVAYFAASGGSKLDQLRRRVKAGEKEVAGARDWSQRTRREAELRGVRRELESAESDAAEQIEQRGTAQQQRSAMVVCKFVGPRGRAYPQRLRHALSGDAEQDARALDPAALRRAHTVFRRGGKGIKKGKVDLVAGVRNSAADIDSLPSLVTLTPLARERLCCFGVSCQSARSLLQVANT